MITASMSLETARRKGGGIDVKYTFLYETPSADRCVWSGRLDTTKATGHTTGHTSDRGKQETLDPETP